jgi:hypothetical protein
LIRALARVPSSPPPSLSLAPPRYLDEDWRVPFSALPKLNEGGGGDGSLAPSEVRTAAASDDADEDEDEDDEAAEEAAEEAALLEAALALSVSAHADPGFFPREHAHYCTATPAQPYAFVTEVVCPPTDASASSPHGSGWGVFEGVGLEKGSRATLPFRTEKKEEPVRTSLLLLSFFGFF